MPSAALWNIRPAWKICWKMYTIMSTAIMTMNTTTMSTMIMNIAVMTMNTTIMSTAITTMSTIIMNTAVMTIIITMADEIFTSWGRETAHQYTEEELEKILQTLSGETGCGTVLRAKGILCMADGTWKQFDLVPGEYEVREGRADYTGRLCVIGTDLAQDQLAELFHLV